MPTRNSFSSLIPFLVLLLSLSGGRRSTLTDDRTVANGTWGGEHIILEVSEKSSVELDCAHGQVVQPITLDKRGDFDVAGTFTPEHGGPVRRDENTPPAAARYSGHVTGDTMTLTITLGKENIGTYTLTRGSNPILRKCR